MLKVQDLMARKAHQKVFSLKPNETVLDALLLMTEHNIGAVVIENKGELFGIVTERDICRRVTLRNARPENVLLGSVMTERHKLVNCTAETSCEEAMRSMIKYNIRHLIVVENNKAIGVISIKDVLTTLLNEKDQVVGHLERFITHS